MVISQLGIDYLSSHRKLYKVDEDLSCQRLTTPADKSSIMLATFFQLTLLVLLPFVTATDLQFKSRSDGPTIFNPPKLRPILHLVPIIDYPTNSSDLFTVIARVQNLGGKIPPLVTEPPQLSLIQPLAGNFSGVINGDILPLGAASEFVAPESDGVKTVSPTRSGLPMQHY